MDRKALDSFRRTLVVKQQELLADMARTQLDGREVGDLDTQDLGDVAFTTYTKESLFQHSDAEHSQLRLVQEALQRMEDGSFGRCTECGTEVEEKRLEAVPWAPHCKACQTLQDSGLL